MAEIVNFGCRLNSYEGEAMRGLVDDDHLVIVNSCAVTNEAVRQTRQAIRKLRRERPDARIVVTGCAAQIDPAMFAAMPEVDRVVGNGEKFDPRHFDFSVEAERVSVNDIASIKATAGHLITGFSERARAFVEVQNGCDHRCTFCIIPFGRGNSRSVPAGLVVEQAKALVGNGFSELVLTGVDLTAWGADLPGAPKLGDLAARILKLVPDLARLRISSVDVIEVDDHLFELLAHEPRLMPHLHLSLQAGDDMILTRMKRRHRRDQAIEFCARLRGLRDVAFGADLIAGFPTETDAMFENSLKLIDQCDIAFAHVFPYSAKAGTPAARMPQVPQAVRKARAQALRTAGAARLAALATRAVGQSTLMLVERTQDGVAYGHGENFLALQARIDAAPGALLAVRITAAHHDHAEAVAA